MPAAQRDRAMEDCGAGATATDRLQAAALAYVKFAVENEGLHELGAQARRAATDKVMSAVQAFSGQEPARRYNELSQAP
ncbi:hypothetical protein ACFWDI_40060 [Streptomyces sp. NPDC060064]|uniref:hypothetical protein n=1 Tax=Streptomyces sp. NPDC060064 TaxID=3347049 RepID=UPI00367740D3